MRTVLAFLEAPNLGKVGVMEAKKKQHPSSKRYPQEMRERAVRMVQQSIEETGERWGVVSRVARQLGIGEQTLRNWVERADIDAGRRPGVTTEDKERIAELEKEIRELRRANSILKSASAFFAAELDRPKP
jgi:transposase